MVAYPSGLRSDSLDAGWQPGLVEKPSSLVDLLYILSVSGNYSFLYNNYNYFKYFVCEWFCCMVWHLTVMLDSEFIAVLAYNTVSTNPPFSIRGGRSHELLMR